MLTRPCLTAGHKLTVRPSTHAVLHPGPAGGRPIPSLKGSRPVGPGQEAGAGRAAERKQRSDVAPGYAVAELEAALETPLDTGAAGFFDVDNTMMQGASIYYLARGLAARKYFTTRDLLRFGVRQLRFRLLASEHGGDMSQRSGTSSARLLGSVGLLASVASGLSRPQPRS